MSKILIVGAKKSGVYAALLAKKKGNEVFVTESNKSDEVVHLKNILDKNNIPYEIGSHSFEKLKGFDIAVLSPGIPLNARIVKYLMENHIKIIGEMEFAFLQSPNTKIIGITGTNGKSTTTALTGHLLKQEGAVVGGNLGTPYSALLLQNEKPSFAVLETSCFQLETIEKYHPYVSVFLNFTEDHLDRYPNMEMYLKAKKRIFENQNSSDFAVLNYDDPVVRNFYKEIKPEVFFFSIKNELEKGTFLDNKGNIVFAFKNKKEVLFNKEIIPLLGMHNVMNVLAAVSSAKIIGIDNKNIKENIMTFIGLEHRLEKVKEIDGVLYVNDSKSTTPDSTIVALESFNSPIILIAGGSSKNNDFTELSLLFPKKLKKLILIGETAKEIAKASKNAGFENFLYANSLKDAVIEAKKIAEKSDIILLSPACASFDMFRDFEDRGEKFKEIVNSL